MEKIHILSLFWCFISALQKKIRVLKIPASQKKLDRRQTPRVLFLTIFLDRFKHIKQKVRKEVSNKNLPAKNIAGHWAAFMSQIKSFTHFRSTILHDRLNGSVLQRSPAQSVLAKGLHYPLYYTATRARNPVQ